MKIHGNQPNLRKQETTSQVEQNKAKALGKQTQAQQAKGSLKVDPNSFAVGKLKAKIDSTPDIDLDKVKALKERIKNGDYQVDAKKLAQNLLKDSAIEDLDS